MISHKASSFPAVVMLLHRVLAWLVMHRFHVRCLLSLQFSGSLIATCSVAGVPVGNPVLSRRQWSRPLRPFLCAQKLESRVECAWCPLCVYLSLFLYICELADDGAPCPLWCLFSRPCRLCGGALLPPVGLGGAPVGGNRLMRRQLEFISMAPSNQSSITTTHAPQALQQRPSLRRAA